MTRHLPGSAWLRGRLQAALAGALLTDDWDLRWPIARDLLAGAVRDAVALTDPRDAETRLRAQALLDAHALTPAQRRAVVERFGLEPVSHAHRLAREQLAESLLLRAQALEAAQHGAAHEPGPAA